MVTQVIRQISTISKFSCQTESCSGADRREFLYTNDNTGTKLWRNKINGNIATDNKLRTLCPSCSEIIFAFGDLNARAEDK